jgi:hypothetical protein
LIWSYPVSVTDAQKIQENILSDADSGDNQRALPCAHSVSTVISGVGPFAKVKPVLILPASLAREVYPIPHKVE